MSIEAICWALNAQVGDATLKLVLIGHANHAHRDGRNAYGSKETIGLYAERHVDTVQRSNKALVAAGWIRRGNQEAAKHIRRDRRPVVYDVAMNEETRQRWAAAAAAGDSSWAAEQAAIAAAQHQPEPDHDAPAERGGIVHPRPDATGMQDAPSSVTHGGASGGASATERGCTAMHPEPSLTQEPSPQPPTSGGRCIHGRTSCRACRTTPRDLERAATRDAAEAQRATDRATAAAEREARRRDNAAPERAAAAASAIRDDLAARRAAR